MHISLLFKSKLQRFSGKANPKVIRSVTKAVMEVMELPADHVSVGLHVLVLIERDNKCAACDNPTAPEIYDCVVQGLKLPADVEV